MLCVFNEGWNLPYNTAANPCRWSWLTCCLVLVMHLGTVVSYADTGMPGVTEVKLPCYSWALSSPWNVSVLSFPKEPLVQLNWLENSSGASITKPTNVWPRWNKCAWPRFTVSCVLNCPDTFCFFSEGWLIPAVATDFIMVCNCLLLLAVC